MSEHRFTHQEATSVALHGLINDMHHVLGRIVLACYWLATVSLVLVAVDAFATRWFSATLGLVATGMLVALGAETHARRRKYRPATKAEAP